ncbi:hypothetical protein GQ44DRAFT_763093 [Phaeosphaeriaceae sp. PMI808]|nr:hypothetical protein GQ44DRAFT_763093 [Phaeosphaeriaceae sp. PMI808]
MPGALKKTKNKPKKPKKLNVARTQQLPYKKAETKKTDDNVFENYDQNHAELLHSEAKQAWDRRAKPKASSGSKHNKHEKQAASIIQAIREYERRTIFGNQATEEIPGPETRDMGGQFLTNKDRIEHRSLLFRIAKLLPKGCLLHLHFNAEIPVQHLLEQARSMENIYVRSTRPLITKEDLDQTEMAFNVLDNSKVEKNVDIFSQYYPGNETNWKTEEWKWWVWMPWKQFRNDFGRYFPDYCKKSRPEGVSLEPAEEWLKSKIVLSEEEVYGLTQTVNGVWARFNQATRCVKGLLNYESAYKWYIGAAIDSMIKDKVMYAELRPMLLDKSIPTDNGEGKVDNSSQMQLIIDAVKEKQAELGEKKLYQFPFGLKIIYCTPRSISTERMKEELSHCIELKQKFPDLICGFDLVGAEDRPNHIGFYKNELISFRKECRKLSLDIPFLFHAGETLLDTGGSVDPSKSNLYDAVLLKTKRIGHGFSLMKHPNLVKKFRKTKTSPGICIELCPISNEILHLCRNIKEHPFPELLAAGIPCTINTDNPSLFSNSMSHEFYQIMVGAPTISLYSWKQLAKWSIEYSCLSATQKKKGNRILEQDWEDFCKLINEKYGSLMDGDKINETNAKALYSKLPVM